MTMVGEEVPEEDPPETPEREQAPPVGLGAVSTEDMSTEELFVHINAMLGSMGLTPLPEPSEGADMWRRGVVKPIVKATTYGLGAIADIRDFYRAGNDGLFKWITGLEPMDHGVNPDGTPRTEAEAAQQDGGGGIMDGFASSAQYQAALRKTGHSEEAPVGQGEKNMATFSGAAATGVMAGVPGSVAKLGAAARTSGAARVFNKKQAYQIMADNTGAGVAGGGLAVAVERWDPNNPVAKMVGEVVGGVGYAMYKNLKRMPEAVLYERLSRLPPAAFEEAHQMIADAERFGIKVLGVEALGDPELLDLAGDVSRTSKIIPQALLGRDKALVDVVEAEMVKKLEFNQVHPRGWFPVHSLEARVRNVKLGKFPDPDDLSDADIGENIMSAASQLLAKARKIAQDAVDPLYAAVTTKDHNIPKRVMVDLMHANPEIRDVYSRLRHTKLLRRSFMHSDGTKANFNNMKSIDALIKQMGQEITAHMEKATGSPLNATIAQHLITAKKELLATVEKFHPQYGDASREFSRLMDLHYKPLLDGEIGRIAKQERFAHVVDTVTNWENISPRLLGQTLDKLAMENPAIPAAVTKRKIEKALMESQDSPRMDKPHGKFAKRFIHALMGNSAKQAQMKALVESIERANGYSTGGMFGGIRRVMQILDRVDNIPKSMNASARRKSIDSTLNPSGEAVSEGLNVLQGSFLQTLNRKLSQIINKRGYDRIATAMTEPNNIETLRRIGQMHPGSVKARALLVNMLNISRGYQENSE